MYNIEIKKTKSPLEDTMPKNPINNSLDALRAALPLFKEEDSWREICHALFLNQQHKIIGTFLVGIGDEKCVPMGVKAISMAALNCLADGVILAHNHPSGNCLPSHTDVDQTKKIKDCLSIFDIDLLDHIVIGEGEYFSFTEEVRLLFNKKTLEA